MALSRHTALMIKKRVFVVGIQAEWRGKRRLFGDWGDTFGCPLVC